MNINSNIVELGKDDNNTVHLYHLGIEETIRNLKLLYGGTKAVIMGGKASRMEQLASEYKFISGSNTTVDNIAKSADRYFMCKVENVIFLSHGMGNPSISIALHEIAKLLHLSNSGDAVIVRFGTCGGIGLEPGSVVITNKTVNSNLSFEFERFICGISHKRPMVFNSKLAEDFMKYADKHNENNLKIFRGNSFYANDFYEEQARLDGAIRVIADDEKQKFMQRLHEEFGVLNIEMETSEFGMFCGQTGIPGMVVCLTIVNRLKDDNIALKAEDAKIYQARLSKLLLGFVHCL